MRAECAASGGNCTLISESCGESKRVDSFKIEGDHADPVVDVFGISVNNCITIVGLFVIFFQTVNQLAVQDLFMSLDIVKTDFGENVDRLTQTDYARIIRRACFIGSGSVLIFLPVIGYDLDCTAPVELGHMLIEHLCQSYDRTAAVGRIHLVSGKYKEVDVLLGCIAEH